MMLADCEPKVADKRYKGKKVAASAIVIGIYARKSDCIGATLKWRYFCYGGPHCKVAVVRDEIDIDVVER